jgi:hypothetical protein
MVNNILGLYNQDELIINETVDENVNMPIIFVKHNSKRPQLLLMDSNPDELFYNPSTKTLHADNFSGGIPSLIEGEGIELTTVNNSTEIDVNFTKNTEEITIFDNADTFLASNSSNALKTITGLNLSNQLRAGLCPLNSNNIIPNQYLPGSVSDILEVANFASLPVSGDSSKIYVTLDNHKAYRWGGTSYIEISASLVIGTTAGTAYDGSSGAQNALDIATKQAQFGTTSTGGLAFIAVGSAGTLQIDMTKSTAETSFDDDEIMLIEKENGDLCRITKQQLKSSINTNTTYNNGTNITIDGSNNINLDSNISTNSAILRTDLVLKVASGSSNNTDYLNNIIFENTATYKTIALTRRWVTGVSDNLANFCIQNGTGATISDSSHPIRLCVRSTGEVNIGSSQTKTHGFNVEGTSNFENTITGTNINITGNYQINGVNLPTTNTEYLLGNNLSFDTSTNPETININNDLTSINNITSQSTSDLTLAAGSSTQSGDKIKFKTNNVKRATINNYALDLSINLNIDGDKAYMLDDDDIFSDLSSTSAKNFRLNCRIIQNLSASISDGLFINYLNNTNDNQNAHLRFYSGGSSTIRMFIENDGKIGINTVNPTEKLEVNGNINVTTGNTFKINGVAIPTERYTIGDNLSLNTFTLPGTVNLDSELINLNSITGQSGSQVSVISSGSIQIKTTANYDIVFTRNNIQIAKISADGFEMLNSKKFDGDIVGPIKPYLVQDVENYDQPIVSYRALSSGVTQLPPGQMQLIIPNSTKLITINHSTGLLKTKSIYVDGNITNVNSITATQFVGTLSGNATTVTNGVYLDETSTQTINGNVGVKQLNIDGTQCIFQQGTNGTDIRGNFRVLTNLSTNNQDGMLINYGSTGGAAADCKIYANGTTERMIIKADNGNVGIGTSTPLEKLDVNGNIYAGNNSFFLSSAGSISGSQFFGKKYGTNSILGGMEIENTTLGGNYSQKVHFKTHYHGLTNGRRMSIDERGYVGINAGTPYSMMNIRDTGTNPVVERAILLGYDNNSNFTTTGLNVGNHSTRPFIWCGGSGNADVTALTFTFGFGWVYNTSGNLQLLRRQSGTTSYPVMTYARNDGCVTFSNTSCASDDRLKFNETKIENALDTVMKLSPELYDKMVPPINENDDNDDNDEDEEIMEFDIENSYKESGFIAQEVEEIPELKFLVRTDTDKFKLKSINYTGIIPYNTKAIQELKLENDKLKNKVDELELKLDLIMKNLNL